MHGKWVCLLLRCWGLTLFILSKYMKINRLKTYWNIRSIEPTIEQSHQVSQSFIWLGRVRETENVCVCMTLHARISIAQCLHHIDILCIQALTRVPSITRPTHWTGTFIKSWVCLLVNQGLTVEWFDRSRQIRRDEGRELKRDKKK